MNYYFTDIEIDQLITEKKIFPGTTKDIMNYKETDGHKNSSIEIHKNDGSLFVIRLRQNLNNVNDFSVILGYQGKGNNTIFKLRRYNGKSHQHTNRIEGNKFYDFHIHSATQRYQDLGLKEESFSEETDRYADIKGALKCMIEDCNITVQNDPQVNLFEE